MQIGDIFREGKEYDAYMGYANNNNLVITEIEPDEQGRRFQLQNIPEPSQRELNSEEYYGLVNWFNTEYTKEEQKLRRLYTLNKLTDEGRKPYDALIDLYNEAEVKRARIQQLEGIINE